jgi:predicted enzyme related to lactoylglutathione lyase
VAVFVADLGRELVKELVHVSRYRADRVPVTVVLPRSPPGRRSTLGKQTRGRKHMAGNIVHFEINAKDPNRAKRFYSSLFGWKYKDSEIPGIEYYLIDGANPGGAINPSQDPGPVIYLDTEDIDASISKVRQLGGKADDKMAIPSQGWFAGCVDTEGNKFSLFQNDPSVTMETEQQSARA